MSAFNWFCYQGSPDGQIGSIWHLSSCMSCMSVLLHTWQCCVFSYKFHIMYINLFLGFSWKCSHYLFDWWCVWIGVPCYHHFLHQPPYGTGDYFCFHSQFYSWVLHIFLSILLLPVPASVAVVGKKKNRIWVHILDFLTVVQNIANIILENLDTKYFLIKKKKKWILECLAVNMY